MIFGAIKSAFKGVSKAIGSVVGGVNKVLGSPLGNLGQDIIVGNLSSQGLEAQNEANIASAREAAAFNAEQAEINRRFQRGEYERARRFSSREASSARMFSAKAAAWAANRSERLSNTAHQREIKDLYKAGLNPILSAKYGGSSTPPIAAPPTVQASNPGAAGGATATRQAASIVDEITPALSTAMQLSRTRADVAAQVAQEQNIRQNTAVQRQQERVVNAQWQRTLEEANKLASEAQLAQERSRTEDYNRRLKEVQITTGKVQAERLRQDIKAMQEKLKGLMNEGRIDETTYGLVVRALQRLNPFVNSGANVARSVR